MWHFRSPSQKYGLWKLLYCYIVTLGWFFAFPKLSTVNCNALDCNSNHTIHFHIIGILLSVPCTSYHCPPILGLSAELVMTYLWGNHETGGWNRGTDTVSLVFIFRSIPVQLSGVAVCSYVMNTDQCHSKTIRSQYHHSQALQLTVDSWQFLETIFYGVASQEIFGGNLV